MPTKLTQEQFISRANQIHNYKYDYTEVEYSGSMSKVTIVCPDHGQFNMLAKSHINDRRGCEKCGRKMLTHEQFLERAHTKHQNKYKYILPDELLIGRNIVVICPEHGLFNQQANYHLKGRGCGKCAGKFKSNSAEFIKKALLVHGDKYTYHRVKYVNAHTKVCITCPKHGIFEQTPNGHLSGRGCFKCGQEATNLYGIYTEHWFNNHRELWNVPAVFYVIRFTNTKESFVKYGITKNNVKTRYKHCTNIPYAYEVISELHVTLYEAFCIEQKIKRCDDVSKYIPQQRFNGWTESVIDTTANLLKLNELVYSVSSSSSCSSSARNCPSIINS